MNLSDVLNYNKETGKLTWKVTVSPMAKAGSEVGWLTEKGYRRFTYKGVTYTATHVIWFLETGEWPKDQIDHKDRQRDNNAFDNLVEADNYSNSLNKPVSGTSKYVGVSYVKNRNKWQAVHYHMGKNNYLGYFDDEDSAKAAYDSYVKEVRGG